MNWYRITAEILEHIASKFREAADEVTVLAEPVKEIEEKRTPINFGFFSARSSLWLRTHEFTTDEELRQRSNDELVTLGMGSTGLDEVCNYWIHKRRIEDGKVQNSQGNK